MPFTKAKLSKEDDQEFTLPVTKHKGKKQSYEEKRKEIKETAEPRPKIVRSEGHN